MFLFPVLSVATSVQVMFRNITPLIVRRINSIRRQRVESERDCHTQFLLPASLSNPATDTPFPFLAPYRQGHFKSSMLISLLAIGVLSLPVALGQYPVDPPTTAPGDTIVDCSSWVVAEQGYTCETLADEGFITLEQLYDYVCSCLLSSPSNMSSLHMLKAKTREYLLIHTAIESLAQR